ncbi:DUF3422 domain-containing protein [bacterium]|nr:DUF3422 domain-containing protein [bacterium]
MENQNQNSALSFKDELHARPYIKLGNNLRVFHFAYLIKENDEKKSWAYLDKFLYKINFQNLPKEASKYWVAEGKDLIIRYECHTEFISLTLIYPNKIDNKNKNKPKLFDENFLRLIPTDFLKNFPGEHLLSSWIEMVPSKHIFKPIDIEGYFYHDNFAGSNVAEDGANVFMSFKSDRTNFLGSGLRRVFIQNKNLRTRRTGRLLQRIVELETYQVLSLLGLPQVRQESLNLSNLEKQITEITKSVSRTTEKNLDKKSITYPDYQQDLNELSYVVAKIEEIDSKTNYRLSATTAYYKLVEQRITDLREDRLESFQTNNEFLSRRLQPAIRTSEAFARRLESLATRAQRADNLVRTQIEMGVQIQNKDLLESMELRARAQLRLQETVESLSIVAITYYIIGLLSTLVEPINFNKFLISKTVFLALSVPIILVVIWFIAKMVRKKIKKIR